MGQSSSAIKQSSNMQSLKSVLLLLAVLQVCCYGNAFKIQYLASEAMSPAMGENSLVDLNEEVDDKFECPDLAVTFTQDKDIAINITSAVTEFLPNFTYSRVPMVSTSTQHPNSAS